MPDACRRHQWSEEFSCWLPWRKYRGCLRLGCNYIERVK